MRNRKEKVIRCPQCNYEYLPAEIYMPNSLLGKPRNISKEHMTGRILEYMGNSMNPVETYICDNCNTEFKVIANINFNTQKMNEATYKTHFKKEKIFLKED